MRYYVFYVDIKIHPDLAAISFYSSPFTGSVLSTPVDQTVDFLAYLGHLVLKAPLKLLQALLHLLLYLLCVGHHLSLQTVHFLLQLHLQLLALLLQSSLQGLWVLSVGGRVFLQLLHLGQQLLGVGLQSGPHGFQIRLHLGLQLLCLLGELRHEVLGQRSHLSAQGVGDCVDGISACCNEGAAEISRTELKLLHLQVFSVNIN